MKTKTATNLEKVYQDILEIKIDPKDSFQSSLNKFYSVMRKHGIKQGTWTENGGRLCNNFEWTMCYDSFKANKISSLDIWLCLSTPPKDLLAYGKQPKLKTK